MYSAAAHPFGRKEITLDNVFGTHMNKPTRSCASEEVA
jgi:hypothetical protein